MELEGAALDRVVENARTEPVLKGETRRKRASIGRRSDADQRERERGESQDACLDLVPDSVRMFFVVGNDVDDVWDRLGAEG